MNMLVGYGIIMALPAAAEPSFRPTSFSFNARVLTPPSLDSAVAAPTVYRLDLPIIAMQAFQHDDLSDIRLFDAKGQSIPIRLITAKHSASSQIYPLDLQPSAASSALPHTARQWVLIAPDNTATPERLNLQWATRHLSTQALVESSQNGQDWQLIGTGQLSQNPSTGELHPALIIGGPPARFFRLTLNQPLQLISGSLQGLDTAKPVAHSQPVEFIKHNQKYVLELEHPMPALGFTWPSLGGNSTQWLLQGLDSNDQVVWSHPLGQPSLLVVDQPIVTPNTQASVSFASPIRAQRWELQGPTTTPLLKANLSWPQQQLLFAGQGQPPYTLAIGHKAPLGSGAPLLDAPTSDTPIDVAQLGLIEHTQIARDWSYYAIWALLTITVLALVRIISRWLTRRKMAAFNEQINDEWL